MKKIIILAAIGAVLAASPASASITNNGIGLNGLKLNGLKLNGLKMNGLKMNGLKMNGTGSVAVTETAVHAITLPSGQRLTLR